MKYKTSDYLRSCLAAFVLAVIWFTPVIEANAQFSVNINSDVSPTTLVQVNNSTKHLVEAVKQGFTQIKQMETGERSFASQIAEYAKEGSRWIEITRHYTNEIFQFARQFTSLKGVLGFALQSAGVKENDLSAMKEWAVALYAVINLKKQFEALWESRITLFRNWWGRTKNGIFNPQQDWLDLQNYFINSVGRRGYEYSLEAERIQQADQEFAKWKQDLEMWRTEEIYYVNKIKKVEEELVKERNALQNLPAITVNDQTGQGAAATGNRMIAETKIALLSNQLVVLQGNLAEVRKEISRLLDLMTSRYVYYYTVYAQGMKDADSYAKEISGWDVFEQIRQDVGGSLMGPTANEATPPNFVNQPSPR